MFCDCYKLKKIIGLNKFDTKNVTTMELMFLECKELEYLDLSSFNTSNVTNMECMFNKCYKLKKIKGINKFNLTSVTNIYRMFRGCFKLKGINLSKFSMAKINKNKLINKKEQSNNNEEQSQFVNKFAFIEETDCLVHFISTDQIIKFSLICQVNDIFSNIVNELYLKFPSLKHKSIFFLTNGNIMNTSATLRENRIKNDNIILIDEND